jgi:hemolysin activation/secretion protein
MGSTRHAGVLALLGVAVICSAVTSAQAQTPQIPASVAPGRVDQPIRQQEQEPRSDEGPSISPGLKPAEAPAGAERLTFTLNSVVIDGASTIPPQEFAPLYKDFVGHTISLKQVYEIAAGITAKYGAQGYILSQALVPAQRISGGVVHIQVVEGFVDQTHIVNKDGSPVDQRMLKIFGEKIARQRPLRAAELERYVLLMNDLPGYTARAYFEPSKTTQGAADLTIVVEKKLLDFQVTADNRGTEYVGPFQASLGIDVNDLLGLGDRTGVRFANTIPFSNLHYEEFHEQIPLGNEGTTLTMTFFASQAYPAGTLTPQNIVSTNYTTEAMVTHPFIRSRSENLTARGKFDVEELTSTSNGALVSNDRLRVLRGSLSYDFVDTWTGPTAISLVGLELSQGLGLFNGSQSLDSNLSRIGMTPDFTKLALQVSRRQPLVNKFSVLVAGSAQYGFTTLPVSEQIGYGGAEFGRGYDPSQIVGDHGVEGRVELQYSGELNDPHFKAYQFYGFYDAGYVWDRTSVPSIPIQQGGMSTGVGARTSLSDIFSLDLQFALPLNTVVSPQQSSAPRVFFGIVGRW